MIKAAHLTGSVSRLAGGLQNSVRRLVQCVSNQDVEVMVFGLTDQFTDNDLSLWEPIVVSTYERSIPKSFGFSSAMYRSVAMYAPDLLHTHGIWQYPSVLTANYCRRNSVPYMISPHGMLDAWAIKHNGLKKKIAFRAFENRHLRGASCLRALNESEAQSIRRLGFRNPIAIIPNGIDLPDPRIVRNALENNPFLSLIEKDASTKILLYLGRLHPKKGLSTLLHAWKLMLFKNGNNESSNWVLAIAGWDQDGHESELKKLATDLGIFWVDHRENNDRINAISTKSKHQHYLKSMRSIKSPLPHIVFLGPKFDMDKASCYANCDAFILPSFSEGLPMVVLEAWAYGKPVIMTPECNLPEGFTQNAALRIEANALSISECLFTLKDLDNRKLEYMGQRGLSLVQQTYTWPSIAKQLKGTYDWMVGAIQPPCSVQMR